MHRDEIIDRRGCHVATYEHDPVPNGTLDGLECKANPAKARHSLAYAYDLITHAGYNTDKTYG